MIGILIYETDFVNRSFPTILYSDYPSSYTFCGTLPTTTAGVATCLRYPCAHPSDHPGPFYSDSPVFAYPSHPPIPNSIQNISASKLALDPKGSTWDAVWSYDGGYAPLIQPLIPDMAAWNCSPFGAWNAAASALQTALYLTATSTSTEAGEEAGATLAAAQAAPLNEASTTAVASKEPAKAEPQAIKASQIFANPFGVEKPTTAAESPVQAPSSPIAVAPVQSPDQAASDNGAGSSTPASNAAPEKAPPNAENPPSPAANNNAGSSIAPAANPASPQAESPNVPSSPNQVANVNQASSTPPAAVFTAPSEGGPNAVSPPNQVVNAASTPAVSNAPSSPEGTPNIVNLLPVLDLNSQVATAAPAAAANAVANVVISSTNAQGSVVVTTSQAPGVVITSTNVQGSQVVTTLPVVSPQDLGNAPKPVPANVVISSTNAQGSIVITTSQAPGVITTVTDARGSQIVMTMPVGSPQVLNNTPKPTPVVVDGHTLFTNTQSQYIIAGQTLTPNTPLILGSGSSTTPIILQTSGINPVLIIGSSTTTLHLTSSTPTTTPPPAITIGTQIITPNAQGQYIVGTQTLTPGGEIVVGSTTPPGGSVAVVGGTTVSLAPSATQAVVGTITEGLAPYIAGGFGSGPNGTTGVVQFLGGGAGRKSRCWGSRYLFGIVIGVVGIRWVF